MYSSRSELGVPAIFSASTDNEQKNSAWPLTLTRVNLKRKIPGGWSQNIDTSSTLCESWPPGRNHRIKIREIGRRGWVKVLRNWNVNALWLSLHPSMQQLFIETSIFANVLLTGQGCPHLPCRHLISHISPLCKVDRHDRPPLSPVASSLLISVTAMLYPSQSTVQYRDNRPPLHSCSLIRT